MNIKDYIEIILELTNKVEKSWSLFFMVNTAIVGWFLTNNKIIPFEHLVFASVIYFLYTWFDLMKLLRGYKFLNLAIEELNMQIDEIDIKSENLKLNLGKLSYTNRYFIVIFTFLTVYIFVNYAIWTRYLSL